MATIRKFVLLLALVLGGLGVAPVSAQTDGPPPADLPTQLECVPWPTEQWPTAGLPAGVDPAAVEELASRIVSPEGGDSVVVIHGGQVVFERYAEGLGPDSLMPSFSLSKSFAATLAGVLIDDGTLDLDERAPIEAWADPDDPRNAITVRHLLTMSSGLEWDETYGDESADPYQLQQAGDHSAFVIERPLQFEPGSQFRYSTGDTAVLAKVIAEAAGVQGPSYEALIRDRLFEPMGMDPALVGFDDVGIWRAGSTTITTTRNYAKLGFLYLRNGLWDGQQLLSPEFVEFARTPALSPSYGAGFWLRGDDRFQMLGILGQGVEIVPSLDLVVAVNNDPNRSGHLGEMVDLFQDVADPECPPEPPATTSPSTTSPGDVSSAGAGPAGGSQLPATGGSGVGTAMVGLLVLGIGIGLVAATRRDQSVRR